MEKRSFKWMVVISGLRPPIWSRFVIISALAMLLQAEYLSVWFGESNELLCTPLQVGTYLESCEEI